MAKYQKVENCGPVPYPDQSGRFLTGTDTVEGDDWEPLVALGFVVKVDEAAAAPAKADPPKAEEPKIEEPKAAILNEGANDGEVQRNDGGRAEEVDPPAAGPAGDEGLSGRSSTRRRR